jgi:hypothetical protein
MRSRPGPHAAPGEASMSSHCTQRRTLLQVTPHNTVRHAVWGTKSYNTGAIMEQNPLIRWSLYEALLTQNVMTCDAIAFSPSTKEHSGVTIEQFEVGDVGGACRIDIKQAY